MGVRILRFLRFYGLKQWKQTKHTTPRFLCLDRLRTVDGVGRAARLEREEGLGVGVRILRFLRFLRFYGLKR